MQVAEGGQDFEDVGDRGLDGQDAVGGLTAHVAQARPADVLHDDVATVVRRDRPVVVDEVEDTHDRRMRELGEELSFGHRDLAGLGPVGVEQALEHDPAVGDVVVDGDVDPAHAAVREAALDLVLVGDDIAGLELGLGEPAVGIVDLLRDFLRRHERRGRVAWADVRQFDQTLGCQREPGLGLGGLAHAEAWAGDGVVAARASAGIGEHVRGELRACARVEPGAGGELLVLGASAAGATARGTGRRHGPGVLHGAGGRHSAGRFHIAGVLHGPGRLHRPGDLHGSCVLRRFGSGPVGGFGIEFR